MTTVLLWLLASVALSIPKARRHRALLAEHTARARHHAGTARRWRDHPVSQAASGAIGGLLAPVRRARQTIAEASYDTPYVRPYRDIAVVDGDGHVRVVTPQRDGAR